MTGTRVGGCEPVGVRHLWWIPGAAGVGFLASFAFTDWLRFPATASQLVHVLLVAGLLGLYVQRTGPPVRAILRRRLGPGLALGVVGGLTLAWRVWADPPSTGQTGILFVWDLLWRGVIYGTIDGLLLSAFPWLVTWRALGGETASVPKRVGLSLLALGCALGVTSAYHLGYPDFRGPKVGKANLGNAIATLPTLLAASPVASPLAHAILHVAAVVHDPQSDLFLPPHELPSIREARRAGHATTLVDIDFPLRGTWRVVQPPGHPREAYDFVGIRDDGWYFSGSWARYLLWTGPASGWSGWSQPVYAPIDGTVVAARDEWPDRRTVNLLHDGLRFLLSQDPRREHPAARGQLRHHPGGRRGGAARAPEKRVPPRLAGQAVTRGALIGVVGNSGNSLVPHLHLQVMDNPDPLTARLVPLRVRRYERWVRNAWQAVGSAMPAGGDRIRLLP